MKRILPILVAIFAMMSCSNSSQLKKVAKEYFIEGKYDLALIEINKLIESEPDSITHYIFRSQIFDLTGKYLEEISDLNKIIDLSKKVNEKSGFAHYQRSLARIQLGFYKEALSDINFFIENRDSSISIAVAYIYKATILYKMNDFENSKRFYNLAIAENIGKEKSIESQALIGLANLTESPKDALELIDKAILIDDSSSTNYGARGGIYIELNEIDLAYNDLLKAISLSNGNEINLATFYDNLGQLYFFYKSNDDSAAKYFEKAISCSRQSSDNDLVYMNLGVIMHRSNNLESASKYFESAEAINPKNDLLMYNFALLLSDLNRNTEALEKINSAIITNPNDADYFDTKGNILTDLSLFNEAEIEYKNAVKINPNSGSTYYNLGFLYGEQNKQKESIKYYDKAVQLNFDLKSTLVNRALQKIKINDKSGACEDLNRAYKLGRIDTKTLIDKICN